MYVIKERLYKTKLIFKRSSFNNIMNQENILTQENVFIRYLFYGFIFSNKKRG